MGCNVQNNNPLRFVTEWSNIEYIFTRLVRKYIFAVRGYFFNPECNKIHINIVT